jgi:PAS domain S-box-containing protein
MRVTQPFLLLRTPASRGAAVTVLVAAAFVVSVHLSTLWATAGRSAAPIFPGTGAALAVLILAGRQYWPAIFVGRLCALAVAASGRPIWLLTAVAATDTVTAWVGAWVLERWGRLDPGLSRLRDVLWLAGAGGGGCSLLGATIGVSTMMLAGVVPAEGYWPTWIRWWMGSLSGVLVLTPLALAWGAGDPLPRAPAYWLHLGACVVTTCLVSLVVFFGSQVALAHTWLVFPVLLWSSLAFGVRGATLAVLSVTLLGVAGAMMGVGFLGWTMAPGVRYILMQQFVTAASFTCLLLAVVADERRGGQALRDREQRLHMALAAARSFGFDLETATNRVTRTAECADILGLAAEEAERGSGDEYRRLIHEDDLPVLEAAERGLSPASPTVSFAYRIRRPDGGIVHLEESARAEFDREGRPTRVVGVTMDVTDRRRAEQEREHLLAREQAARRDAEHATQLRDEFLGTVSHELRTPLNAILGWAQILQAGSHTTAALQSGLATIARNARLQAQLVDDLLDLSRMSAGRLRLEAEATDLVTVVREAVLAVTPAASARHVYVQHDDAAHAAVVNGDADRLQQVFWNLLVNAVKFTEPGGKVRVQIDVVDGSHRVRVSDTGQGIAAEFLPHVFDRFRQADGSTTRRHSGLGIGLSLVSQIVELHGGTVRAESRGEGLGATFTVQLPARRPSSEAATPAVPTTPDARRVEARDRVTVLIVDDDTDARDVAAHFLQGGGAHVITATGAEEGVRLLRDHRPDVVVADIGMPGTDGYAFIRAVRGLHPDDGAATPAVALTALVREEDRRRALDAGYQSHLAKPVSREALLSTVSRLHRPRHRA